MLRFDARIHPTKYENGLLLADLCMAFYQNDPGMRLRYKERYLGHPKLPASWVVKDEAGSLAWEMDVTLLQFEDAQIQDASRTGRIEWKVKPSNQLPANREDAENVLRLRMND